MSERTNDHPIELRASVDRETAEEAVRILNWFFDERPDHYLIQKPRTVYDSEGNARTTVRYQIKQKEQEERKEESNNDKQGNVQQQYG